MFNAADIEAAITATSSPSSVSKPGLNSAAGAAATGLAVVFAILIILMLVTSLFKFIFKTSSKTKEENKPSVAAKVETQPVKAEFKPGFDTEDGELVSVIASSIAAYLNTGSGDIKIRSIRKVN